MLFLYKDQVIQSDLGFDNILGLSPPPTEAATEEGPQYYKSI